MAEKKQPIVEDGRHRPRLPQRTDHIASDARLQPMPQLVRCANDRVGEKSGVDQRLPVCAEIAVIRGLRIGAGIDRPARHVRSPGAQAPFVSFVKRQLQPRRNAAQRSAERFQMRALAAVDFRLDGHPFLQLAFR